MTKAAVAQQVRALEQEIGARLVERNGRGLRLTEAGAAGAARAGEGFALLAKAARAMREGEGRRFLVINSSALVRRDLARRPDRQVQGAPSRRPMS